MHSEKLPRSRVTTRTIVTACVVTCSIRPVSCLRTTTRPGSFRFVSSCNSDIQIIMTRAKAYSTINLSLLYPKKRRGEKTSYCTKQETVCSCQSRICHSSQAAHVSLRRCRGSLHGRSDADVPESNGPTPQQQFSARTLKTLKTTPLKVRDDSLHGTAEGIN